MVENFYLVNADCGTYFDLCKKIKMAVFIQGDSGGICSTLGNDSMCGSKQKSSYKHVSDFRRLRSYG
jgi:hypothetical protein